MPKYLWTLLLGLASCGGANQTACLFHQDDDICDGRDNDCDGQVDEDQDCFPTGAPICASDPDCDDLVACTIDLCAIEGCLHLDHLCTESSPIPPISETKQPCAIEDRSHQNVGDGRDNDCDGVTDEWGWGGDLDGDKVPDAYDCDPDDALRWTGAPEICQDGLDSDCDGDDSSFGDCSVTVGAIDAWPVDQTWTRLTIAGNLTKGLLAPAGADPREIVVAETGQPWKGEGVGVLYHFIVPHRLFLPRLITATDSTDFDLSRWRLTGSLIRVPARTGSGVELLVR